MRKAVLVGRADRQHLVVARDQPHLDRRARYRARQRMDEHVDAVMCAVGRETQVRDDEPLRGELAVVVGEIAFRRRGYGVDAGAQIAQRLLDRKRGGDFGVELLLDDKLAAPYLGTALVGEAFGLVAAQIALEVVAKHGVDQVTIADAIDRERDRAGIHAQYRNAALAIARQHIGLAGKARERLAVAHEDGEVGRLRQRLTHHRRQAGAQRDTVTLAVLEAFDAKLLVVGRSPACRSGDRHERREIGTRPAILPRTGNRRAAKWRRIDG